MQQKTCTSCKKSKPIDDFFTHKLGKYGVDSKCKLCKKEYDIKRKSTPEYKEAHAKREREWRKNNPEKYKNRIDANRDNIRKASRECGRRWRKTQPERNLFYHAKARAKREQLPFDLEITDVIIPTHCPVLGIELKTGEDVKPFADNGANIDKIVPSKGYVKGNICVISGRANRLKSNGTLAEFEAIVRYIKEKPDCQIAA